MMISSNVERYFKRTIRNSKVHLKIMIPSNQRHLSSLVNHLNSIYATEYSVSASTFLNYRNILDLPFSHIIASPKHTICVQEIANSFIFFISFSYFLIFNFIRRVLAVSNLVYENDTRWMLKKWENFDFVRQPMHAKSEQAHREANTESFSENWIEREASEKKPDKRRESEQCLFQ